MIPEMLEDKNPHDFNISADQKKCLQELVERLKDITLRIEGLDRREGRVIGDSEQSEDERRALDISRCVLVNEQKDIENRISDILNNGHSLASEEPPGVGTDLEPPMLEEDVGVSAEGTLPGMEEKAISGIIPFYPEEKTELKGGVKKALFKFHVRSFKVCHTCSARVPANFRICGRCGTKLENFCPYCSADVPEGMAYCGKCGRRIF
ncbi:MAG: zinc ribbon domain-containing protein [Thermoplasmata archaeon]|nr:zinc ribbon domain-containing protein [Thermoplasmata archaeon]